MIDETERESTKGADRQNCMRAADKVMLPATRGQIQFISPGVRAQNVPMFVKGDFYYVGIIKHFYILLLFHLF